VLPYVLQALSATISGLAGLAVLDAPSFTSASYVNPTYGQPVAIFVLIALGVALARGWRPPPLFWAAALTLVGLWAAACLGNPPTNPARPAEAGRYLPINAVLLFVCICSALPRPRLGRTGVVIVCVLLAIVAATNAAQYSRYRNTLVVGAVATRDQLGAMEIMRGIVRDSFRTLSAYTGANALKDTRDAKYLFWSINSYGLTFSSPSTILRGPRYVRALVDRLLVRGERIHFTPVVATPPTTATAPAVLAGSAPAQRGCLVLGPAPVTVVAPAAGILVTASPGVPVTAALARFGTASPLPIPAAAAGSTASPVPILGVPAGSSATLGLPADGAPRVPWRIVLRGARAQVCSLA
jgi:hypothetical protein